MRPNVRSPRIADDQSRRPGIAISLLRDESIGLVVGGAEAFEPLVEPGPHVGVGEDIEVFVANSAQGPRRDLRRIEAGLDRPPDLRRPLGPGLGNRLGRLGRERVGSVVGDARLGKTRTQRWTAPLR